MGIEDPDLMPRPCDLEREMGIAGPEVTLGDGNAWRVPLVRRWDAQRLEHVTMLPQAMRTVMEGGGAGGKRRVVIEVTPEYASVDASADRIFAGFTEGVTVPLEEVFAQAVELLAVNYRIGQEEAGLLGLLDEARALEILGMCIDLPAMNAHAAELMMQGLQPGSDPVIEAELYQGGGPAPKRKRGVVKKMKVFAEGRGQR